MAKRGDERLSTGIRKWCDKVRVRLDIIPRALFMEMTEKIVIRTPVDTGEARGGWQASVNSIVVGATGKLDKLGGSTISFINMVASSAHPGDILYLVNNVPHIRFLEYGWSQQAPAGMVRITVGEYQAAIWRAIRKAQREAP